VADDVPVLGICYGHQLLAHAMGGKVGYHPGGREIGTVTIELTRAGQDDLLLGTLPDRFKAQVSHQQSVLELPANAVRLAANTFESNHAFRIGRCAWGVQFHPEFSEAIVRQYIEARYAALKNEKLQPDLLLAATHPTPEASGLLRRFAELALGE